MLTCLELIIMIVQLAIWCKLWFAAKMLHLRKIFLRNCLADERDYSRFISNQLVSVILGP
jgi:hypothetical protein